MFYGPEIVLKTIKAALGVLAGWRAARDWECLHPINGVTDPFPEGLPAPNPTVTSPYPRTWIIHTDVAAALEVFSSSGKISVSLIQTERRRSQQLPVSLVPVSSAAVGATSNPGRHSHFHGCDKGWSCRNSANFRDIYHGRITGARLLSG